MHIINCVSLKACFLVVRVQVQFLTAWDFNFWLFESSTFDFNYLSPNFFCVIDFGNEFCTPKLMEWSDLQQMLKKLHRPICNHQRQSKVSATGHTLNWYVSTRFLRHTPLSLTPVSLRSTDPIVWFFYYSRCWLFSDGIRLVLNTYMNGYYWCERMQEEETNTVNRIPFQTP